MPRNLWGRPQVCAGPPGPALRSKNQVPGYVRQAEEASAAVQGDLNEAARIGLCGKGLKRATKFAQKSFRMGEAQEFRWDKALAVAGAMEDEELSRKIALRK